MSGKNVIVDDKKIKKSAFSKTKKLFKIDDIDVNKYWFLKKNHMVEKAHLNTSLDIMMMVSLEHYV